MAGGGSSRGPSIPKSGSTRSSAGKVSGKGDADSCLLINEELRLQSPKEEVIVKLVPGDTLEVVANGNNPPVFAMTSNGEIAGSIVPGSLQSLLQCMESGHEYTCQIKSIKSGMCIVTLKHK